MNTRELINIINSFGTIEEILNNYELIDKIINFEDKHLIYVFVEMLNHSISTHRVWPKDLENLKDSRLILSLIRNNDEEMFVTKLKYLCYIKDINVQISLFTNPVVINLIAECNFDLKNISYLYLDTRLKIIEGLIRMNYYEKALEFITKINEIAANERDYYEERDKSVPSRW